MDFVCKVPARGRAFGLEGVEEFSPQLACSKAGVSCRSPEAFSVRALCAGRGRIYAYLSIRRSRPSSKFLCERPPGDAMTTSERACRVGGEHDGSHDGTPFRAMTGWGDVGREVLKGCRTAVVPALRYSAKSVVTNTHIWIMESVMKDAINREWPLVCSHIRAPLRFALEGLCSAGNGHEHDGAGQRGGERSFTLPYSPVTMVSKTVTEHRDFSGLDDHDLRFSAYSGRFI